MYNLSSDWILRRCWIYFLVHWQNFFHVKLMTMFVAVYFAFSYYFAGGTATYKTYLNVSYFHDLAREISEAELLISKTKFPDIPIWLGETSDAYNSGTKNVSDRFVSGFLWVAVTIFQFFMGNVRANAISLLEMFSYTYLNWHFLKKLLLLYMIATDVKSEMSCPFIGFVWVKRSVGCSSYYEFPAKCAFSISAEILKPIDFVWWLSDDNMIHGNRFIVVAIQRQYFL